MNFNSPTKGRMSADEVIADIKSYVRADVKKSYNIVIGTDSQVYSRTDFITAIVVHRVGAGGRYFWARDQHDNFKTLRDRIYTETQKSLEVAGAFSNQLAKALAENKFNFEIHVDVGENGDTRAMIKEVTGMVRGNGYEVKIKPFSFGAFVVADRHT